MPEPPYATGPELIRAAAERIAPYTHRTPVTTNATLDRRAGRHVVLKCEHLQRAGAFKFRGACNAVLQLDPAAAARGVVTHSSGNHAQALALAAQLRGIPAHVVMPRDAARIKRAAALEYGARIVECEPTLAAREATASQIAAETGATLVPPYDHPDVISGQGTVALEMLAEASPLDAIVAPVGGGGLMAGICIAAAAADRSVRLFAAEPRGADDAARSMAAGERIPQLAPHTIADGLRTSLGTLTWPIIRDHVERVITVEEDDIIAAMRLMWERAKLLIEPSAAVAVAAVLSSEFRALHGLARVGVVLTGGNVDLERLPW